ncbi:hypothetical protein VHUM_03959 [Vanrija humicola]|uniref:PQ-loop repeat-containing protein n=1 Tax=Vanrija humicola TaxID=5417 RepID=A0A7D8UZ35_VANHU|nr:hypothetical protein VHUM_03959 [Vanrija humicola]
MKEIPAADKTLATIGAILWSIQVVPQIWKSHRDKSTEGLSPILMFVWGMATIFQGSYLVSQRSSIPLQIQPQCFGFLCVISWAQCLRYGSKWSLKRVFCAMAIFYAFFVGFQVGSVYALWAGQRAGRYWPGEMYGWITSALLIIGLLPEYYEIYKHKEVVGISLLFMAVDIGGGIFSGLSLFFRKDFDKIAFIQYFLVVLLDGAIIVLAWILNPIARRRRAQAAAMEDGTADAEAAGIDAAAQPRSDASESSTVADDDDDAQAKIKAVDDAYSRTPTLAPSREVNEKN